MGEAVQRKAAEKKAHREEMEQLRVLRKQRAEERVQAQCRRDQMITQADSQREQAAKELCLEVKAQANEEKENREERLLRRAEEFERNNVHKYEARMIQKKKEEALARKERQIC